jgi:hypothetical protein
MFCKKGDNPQNMNFTREERRWLPFTYDKFFERWETPPPILIILEDGVVIFYVS